MIAALLFLLVPALAPAPAAQSAAVPARTQTGSTTSGFVHDANGAVPGASVVARTPSGSEQRTVTGPDGRFTIALPPPFEVSVLVSGFAPKKMTVAVGSPEALDILLTPAPVQEQVTVTPTRGEQRSGDVPASVNVLNKDDIRQSPAVVADDVLKQIPTFSLFTRLDSLAAHPTSQGVSLRGIGPSGVSRTLVLLDGVPFNDPFGGWVYWTRIPLESAEHIEVVDGTSSSLYGNYAMGGVINVLTARPTKETVEFKTQYGNLNSPKVDFRGSNVWGKLGVSVDGSAFDTDGFPLVAASERGLVDNNAWVKFKNFSGKADYALSDTVHLFARAGYFHEERANGKVSTIDGTEEGNHTTWKTVSAGVRAQLHDGSSLQATLFTDNEELFSNFLAVPAASPARSIGRVSLNQTVPTKGVGGMTQWSKPFTSNQVLTVGADWRWVEGESQEIAMDSSKGITPVTSRFSGGSQQLGGAFVQDVITPMSRLEITLSARVDHWRNYNPHNLETTIATGLPTANNKLACTTAGADPKTCLNDRSDTVGSPHAAALYHITKQVGVWGDFGYGFRAPTLNELYRQFSKGAVTTKPNDQLGPERLKGGEVGVNIEPMENLSLRVTWYDNRVKNPVSNVSLNAAQTQIQRQNLGRTRIWGVQSDVEYRVGTHLKFAGAYMFDQAKVVEFNTDPSLGLPSIVGNYLPQVPVHRGTFRVMYANPKYFNAAVSVLATGRQFNDDQNVQFVPAAALAEAGYASDASTASNPGLPGVTTVDLTASRDIGRTLQVYFAAQNLFNREYFTALLPTAIAAPRMVSFGFRIRVAGR